MPVSCTPFYLDLNKQLLDFVSVLLENFVPNTSHIIKDGGMVI